MLSQTGSETPKRRITKIRLLSFTTVWTNSFYWRL